MQTRNWRAEIKATYLPSDSGRNSEERTPADLNGFQLWARWWYTVGCSKERWWALQTHQESKLWPRHTIRDFQTKLPPPTLCATEFFFSFFFLGSCAWDPVLRENVSLRFSPAFQRWPTKATVRGAPVWPPSRLHACYSSSRYAHTGNSLRLTPFHPSKQLEGRIVGGGARSRRVSRAQKVSP